MQHIILFPKYINKHITLSEFLVSSAWRVFRLLMAETIHVWRVAVNALDKQSQRAERSCPPD